MKKKYVIFVFALIPVLLLIVVAINQGNKKQENEFPEANWFEKQFGTDYIQNSEKIDISSLEFGDEPLNFDEQYKPMEMTKEQKKTIEKVYKKTTRRIKEIEEGLKRAEKSIAKAEDFVSEEQIKIKQEQLTEFKERFEIQKDDVKEKYDAVKENFCIGTVESYLFICGDQMMRMDTEYTENFIEIEFK